jgi:Zn-dependent peptidase ImmA (M78 family)
VGDRIPVDIEGIVERQLDMRIVPIRGLNSEFGIEGFTSSDWREISIDEDIYMRSEVRSRFTLGHEVGHLILHRELLEAEIAGFGQFRSVDDWIRFISSIGDTARDRLEYQGYTFSGMLLVPTLPLSQMFSERLPSIEDQVDEAKAAGIGRESYIKVVTDSIARTMAPAFEMSIHAVSMRIDNSGLADRIR